MVKMTQEKDVRETLTQEQLIKENMGTLAKMNELNGTSDDVNVLFAKLVYMNHKHHGRKPDATDEYKMPEDFDYDAFEEKYQRLATPIK